MPWVVAVARALDLILPPRCAACGAPAWADPERATCRACRLDLTITSSRCPRCGRRCGPAVPWIGCAACAGSAAARDALRLLRPSAASLQRRAIGGVSAAYSYRGTARRLVLALKFRGGLPAVRPLSARLAEVLREAGVPGDLLVPVPLSWRRRQARGYDQAGQLARALAHRLDLPSDARALVRARHTPAQSGRGRTARGRGMGGAFVARRHHVTGRSVILVDDVLTSGATARAAATALRRAGAHHVHVAVACRAEVR